MEHGKWGPAAGSPDPGCDVICCGLEPSGGSWVSGVGGLRQKDRQPESSWPQLPDVLPLAPLGHLEKRYRLLRE